MELKRECAIIAGETKKKVPPILPFSPPTLPATTRSLPLRHCRSHTHMRREIRGANTHHHLQDDLVEHLWILKENV
jgi:hypothetical protein